MTTTVLQKKLLPTLDFLLFEWLDSTGLLERPRFADHSADTCRDLLRAASDVAARWFEPANRISDLREPYVNEAGEVVLPRETHAAWEAYRNFGFLAASHDAGHGGLQLPKVVDMATRVVFAAAGGNLTPALLTDANASLILAHGTEAQKRVFAVAQLEGRWTGTMAMSESEAGSSLSDITTRAVADGEDYDADPLGPRYRLTGAKMWISAAEHQLAENIVHLVLAKIPREDGAVDPSARGISLFIVPKFVIDSEGRLLERNDVSLVGLNHKLGNRGTPNTALALGDGTHEPFGAPGAVGYLVGGPGEGLGQMFHMMNAARTEIGLNAAACGFAGYALSLDYARHRLQGRTRTRTGKDASRPQVPIIEHADVRRMLLAQKSYSEGAIALALYAARLLDEQTTGDQDQVHEASQLLEILTPVVKSWPSEWCLEGNSLAIQVLGGAGYTREFMAEQYWRDQRLNMIHEGTHGIQALDLLGRKVRLHDGALLESLGRVIGATIHRAKGVGLGTQAAALDRAWAVVMDTAVEAWSSGEPEDALANATPFMQGFGHTVLAWIHLDLAIVAVTSSHPDARGRLAAMEYFFLYELPKIDAWLQVAADRVPLCRLLDVDVL